MDGDGFLTAQSKSLPVNELFMVATFFKIEVLPSTEQSGIKAKMSLWKRNETYQVVK